MPLVEVLYEDNHIIAVVKPAGVLSQPDKTGTPSMLDEVKKYLKEKYQKPGNVFVGLVHRLDRPASGIVLFAKTSKGAARLSEQFRNKTVQKTYHVLVEGAPLKQKGVLENKLGKDSKLLKAKEYQDGEAATLHYEVVRPESESDSGRNKKYSLLKIMIDTGKFHQIRAQLSLAGMPIVGDVKYGSKEPFAKGEIALCATGLVFKKATEDEVVTLQIGLPDSWAAYIMNE